MIPTHRWHKEAPNLSTTHFGRQKEEQIPGYTTATLPLSFFFVHILRGLLRDKSWWIAPRAWRGNKYTYHIMQASCDLVGTCSHLLQHAVQILCVHCVVFIWCYCLLFYQRYRPWSVTQLFGDSLKKRHSVFPWCMCTFTRERFRKLSSFLMSAFSTFVVQHYMVFRWQRFGLTRICLLLLLFLLCLSQP